MQGYSDDPYAHAPEVVPQNYHMESTVPCQGGTLTTVTPPVVASETTRLSASPGLYTSLDTEKVTASLIAFGNWSNQTLQSMANATSNPQSAFFFIGLAIFALSIIVTYLTYKIIMAKIGLLLGTIVAFGIMLAIRQYLSIIKQAETQKEWMRSIGSNLPAQLAGNLGPGPFAGKRALLTQGMDRIEELVD
jgi:hypothetical protein